LHPQGTAVQHRDGSLGLQAVVSVGEGIRRATWPYFISWGGNTGAMRWESTGLPRCLLLSKPCVSFLKEGETRADLHQPAPPTPSFAWSLRCQHLPPMQTLSPKLLMHPMNYTTTTHLHASKPCSRTAPPPPPSPQGH
jgi:hypothetical protein